MVSKRLRFVHIRLDLGPVGNGMYGQIRPQRVSAHSKIPWLCPSPPQSWPSLIGLCGPAFAQGTVRSVHGDWQIRYDTPPGSHAEQCVLI